MVLPWAPPVDREVRAEASGERENLFVEYTINE